MDFLLANWTPYPVPPHELTVLRNMQSINQVKSSLSQVYLISRFKLFGRQHHHNEFFLPHDALYMHICYCPVSVRHIPSSYSSGRVDRTYFRQKWYTLSLSYITLYGNSGIFKNKYVGPYFPIKMYAGCVACDGEYADRTDGQTDGRQTVTLRFLLDAAIVIRLLPSGTFSQTLNLVDFSAFFEAARRRRRWCCQLNSIFTS